MTDDTWKSDTGGARSQSPSPVPSLINRSNASISLSSIEPPAQPTTNINLEVYDRTTASGSSGISSSLGSFNFEFESINLDNDFPIDVPTVTNSVVIGSVEESGKEPKPIEKLFFGLFKNREDGAKVCQENVTRTHVPTDKQVKRKHSLACLSFFKKEQQQHQDDANAYPKKSILKSKVNHNYKIEQFQTKLDDSLSFSQFMDKFEHVESEKLGNEEKLSTLRLKQLRDYYSQMDCT
ncbi:hypothetical protein Cantr_05999 [Candida viswanathii]|uniref:Uncharacterized protein n=1 Tax=Candida viswanathii TaxID=5486 RepID=A0A367XQS8_9ASCO|nr:hypothetical protein Cantr_05999 [Candida viswanathii]